MKTIPLFLLAAVLQMQDTVISTLKTGHVWREIVQEPVVRYEKPYLDTTLVTYFSVDTCDSCRCRDSSTWFMFCPYWSQYCAWPG